MDRSVTESNQLCRQLGLLYSWSTFLIFLLVLFYLKVVIWFKFFVFFTHGLFRAPPTASGPVKSLTARDLMIWKD
jgi:hypothetical protein